MENLWCPKCCSMTTSSKFFMTIICLHNFFINTGENIFDHETVYGHDNDELTSIEEELGYLPSDLSIIDVPGNSTIRTIILNEIDWRGITRPHYNLVRNNNIQL